MSTKLKIKVKIDTKCVKTLNNMFWRKLRPNLGPSISGTKCDRDKPIIFAEKGGKQDRDEPYKGHPVELKMSKTRVITTEAREPSIMSSMGVPTWGVRLSLSFHEHMTCSESLWLGK